MKIGTMSLSANMIVPIDIKSHVSISYVKKTPQKNNNGNLKESHLNSQMTQNIILFYWRIPNPH